MGRKEFASGSEFIRAQSSELTTAAVIAKAALFGLKITPNLVRIVRYKMRLASGDTTPRKRGRKPGPKPAATKRGRKRGFTTPKAPADPTPTGKRRGRPPKKASDIKSFGLLGSSTIARRMSELAGATEATGLQFDHVGSRIDSKLTTIRKQLDGNYSVEDPTPTEPNSSAREADTFCRIVTKIGTTKARCLLDELEK